MDLRRTSCALNSNDLFRTLRSRLMPNLNRVARVSGQFVGDLSVRGPNVVAVVCLLIPTVTGGFLAWVYNNGWYALAGLALGALLSLAPRVARQWERGVVLRLGK